MERGSRWSFWRPTRRLQRLNTPLSAWRFCGRTGLNVPAGTPSDTSLQPHGPGLKRDQNRTRKMAVNCASGSPQPDGLPRQTPAPGADVEPRPYQKQTWRSRRCVGRTIMCGPDNQQMHSGRGPIATTANWFRLAGPLATGGSPVSSPGRSGRSGRSGVGVFQGGGDLAAQLFEVHRFHHEGLRSALLGALQVVPVSIG